MQTNRFIYRHPAPGCVGKTAVVEYTPSEWESAPWTESQRRLLAAGIVVRMDDVCIVDLVARYNLSDRAAVMLKGAA